MICLALPGGCLTQLTRVLCLLAADDTHCPQAQCIVLPDALSAFLVSRVLAAGGSGSHCPEAKAGGSKATHCQGEGLGVCQDPAAA